MAGRTLLCAVLLASARFAAGSGFTVGVAGSGSGVNMERRSSQREDERRLAP
jgi:hypothetical protein